MGQRIGGSGPGGTTADIYRSTNSPPSAPDVEAVPIELAPAWQTGQNSYAGAVAAITFTHVALVGADVDIRDGYTGANTFTEQDSIYIPDKNGTQLLVVFVEIVGRGTTKELKRVFLDRATPSWPTNNL